jgi:hypothetical protein
VAHVNDGGQASRVAQSGDRLAYVDGVATKGVGIAAVKRMIAGTEGTLGGFIY